MIAPRRSMPCSGCRVRMRRFFARAVLYRFTAAIGFVQSGWGASLVGAYHTAFPEGRVCAITYGFPRVITWSVAPTLCEVEGIPTLPLYHEQAFFRLSLGKDRSSSPWYQLQRGGFWWDASAAEGWAQPASAARLYGSFQERSQVRWVVPLPMQLSFHLSVLQLGSDPARLGQGAGHFYQGYQGAVGGAFVCQHKNLLLSGTLGTSFDGLWSRWAWSISFAKPSCASGRCSFSARREIRPCEAAVDSRRGQEPQRQGRSPAGLVLFARRPGKDCSAPSVQARQPPDRRLGALPDRLQENRPLVRSQSLPRLGVCDTVPCRSQAQGSVEFMPSRTLSCFPVPLWRLTPERLPLIGGLPKPALLEYVRRSPRLQDLVPSPILCSNPVPLWRLAPERTPHLFAHPKRGELDRALEPIREGVHVGGMVPSASLCSRPVPLVDKTKTP